MEKEVSSGANLGVVLIALAAIIALGFGIFAIAKGVANEGVTGVQDSLRQVSQSSFTDFDQKVVTGTRVVSAYNDFVGKPYAVLIATQAYTDAQDAATPTTVVGVTAPPVSTNVEIDTSNGDDADLVFLNYNALLGSVDDTTAAALELKNGVYITKYPFKTDDTGSMIEFNNITAKLNKSGMTEFVSSGGRFQANLIKDISGTIMGIAFQQVSSK